MRITPFAVEQWMNEWETRCDLNLAETCVQSLTIAQLLEISGQNNTDLSALLPMKMTYGAIEGSDRLRDAVSALYSRQKRDTIIVTHGTIGANMLVYKTLVAPGDRVVAILPTYQQHYSIPESMGAQVERLYLAEKDGWLPDLDRLRSLAGAGTRLIALTNPNNPTGALIPEAMLMEIAEIARRAGAWVLCDEVYRGTEQEGGLGPSMADIYEKGISTASTSKAFSLAGLRLGWVAAPQALIDQIAVHRDYDTISVGMIDDHFAALALDAADRILDRSRSITRGNLKTLSAWVGAEPGLSWIPPQAGTTALLKYDLAMTSRELCVSLLRDTGVMLTPGSALEMEGYMRIGYANSPAILAEGLARMSSWFATQRA